MLPQPRSPTLPGVTILPTDATGPQYARWRRGVKIAFLAKGTWGHCDGSSPMPMPEAGPNFFSPVTTTNPQPELLEQRKAWVKMDRDVKMGIFLSVSDDIKLEIFEVGPPMPPTAMTAQQMMEALDAHFQEFKFEDYHHVFCHFLNLHIDQYANLDDFNSEFSATLEDLLDHGHPMSNIQACSAYFSKLRCTQNPWVSKKLKEWDSLSAEPVLKDLMKESPPWVVVRPLATKPTSQQSVPESIPEENLEDTPGQSEGEEAASEKSDTVTVSSKSSHSRQSSNSTQKSQEITVHASYEDLTDLEAFPMPTARLPPNPIPQRLSSMKSFSKLNVASLAPPPPPVNRPLPPLPPGADQSGTRSRSVSPRPPSEAGSQSQLKASQLPTSRPQTPQHHPKNADQTHIHPALRSTSPTPTPSSEIHPALRSTTPSPAPSSQQHISTAMRPRTSSGPSPSMKQSAFLSSSPNINVPSTPELLQRPHSSRGLLPPSSSIETFNSWPQTRNPLLRVDSSNSSMISLPLQGTIVPEYHDMTITEVPNEPSSGKSSPSKMSIMSRPRQSSSPPRSIVSRLSAESGDEKKNRKSRSWSIKARLSGRRYEIQEII